MIKVCFAYVYCIISYKPYPITDAGRLVEYTKVAKRILLKEFGKLTLYLRNKEVLFYKK